MTLLPVTAREVHWGRQEGKRPPSGARFAERFAGIQVKGGNPADSPIMVRPADVNREGRGPGSSPESYADRDYFKTHRHGAFAV